MKIHPIYVLPVLLAGFLLTASRGAAETPEEQLLRAFHTHKPDEALAALNAGVNPNGVLPDELSCSRGFTNLMRCVDDMNPPHPAEWRAVFDRLLALGADVNLEDKGGFNPMMVAVRDGSGSSIQLLKDKGAKPLDLTSVAVRAHLVAPDARLLEAIVDQYSISHMLSGEVGKHHRKELTWAFLWASMQDEHWGIVPTDRLVVNRGKDDFGNEFRLFSASGETMPIVVVSDKTIQACATHVDKDFWKDFTVPKEKWDGFIAGNE